MHFQHLDGRAHLVEAFPIGAFPGHGPRSVVRQAAARQAAARAQAGLARLSRRAPGPGPAPVGRLS